MSRYLIRRIEEKAKIEQRTHTEITALEGSDHLERVPWRDNQTGKVEPHAQGFIKTGSDLSPEELVAARWQLARIPFLLESSLPGVFAVRDVRGGNIKRVASAVGEGSIAVSFVHQVLAE